MTSLVGSSLIRSSARREAGLLLGPRASCSRDQNAQCKRVPTRPLGERTHDALGLTTRHVAVLILQRLNEHVVAHGLFLSFVGYSAHPAGHFPAAEGRARMARSISQPRHSCGGIDAG